ncbi:MAG: hypothetical protein JNK56_19495 [Myxococcales bacterium]|nr:hypothetical protein [Myxococcales bacterium]
MRVVIRGASQGRRDRGMRAFAITMHKHPMAVGIGIVLTLRQYTASNQLGPDGVALPAA